MAQHDCTLSLRTYYACCALQGSAEEPYSIGFFLEEIGSESDGIEMMEVRLLPLQQPLRVPFS